MPFRAPHKSFYATSVDKLPAGPVPKSGIQPTLFPFEENGLYVKQGCLIRLTRGHGYRSLRVFLVLNKVFFNQISLKEANFLLYPKLGSFGNGLPETCLGYPPAMTLTLTLYNT
jgi:hypothetical protein